MDRKLCLEALEEANVEIKFRLEDRKAGCLDAEGSLATEPELQSLQRTLDKIRAALKEVKNGA